MTFKANLDSSARIAYLALVGLSPDIPAISEGFHRRDRAWACVRAPIASEMVLLACLQWEDES